jgi:hypothetical protein
MELGSLLFFLSIVIYQFLIVSSIVHNTNFDYLCSTLFPIVDEPKNVWDSIIWLSYLCVQS